MTSQEDVKRSLFGSQISSQIKNNQKRQISEEKENSVMTGLKESIYSQQKQRIKGKFQRNLKEKESQLIEMAKKYQQAEDQRRKILQKCRNAINQRDQLQQKITQLSKQYQQLQAKLSNKYNTQIKSQQQQITSLKAQTKKLSEQLSQSQLKCQNLSKQHKISMRRSTTAWQQARLQLESKLSIRQKQQQKVESLFQQKKKQFNLTIQEKDEERTRLIKEIQTLKNQCDRLQAEIASFQQSKMEDYRQFQKEVTLMEAIIDENSTKHTAFITKLTQSFQKFKQNLHLTTEEQDIFQLIDKMQEELINRIQQNYHEEIVNSYLSEIQRLKQSQKEIANKNKILEDQIAFMRSQNVKNHDFADIIKAHIKNIDQKIISTEKIEQKTKEIRQQKYIEKVVTKPLQTTQNYHSYDANHTKQAIRCHQQQILRKGSSEKSLEVDTKKPFGKSANDFLKEQLESRKKSLIYLMYRPSQIKENIQKDAQSHQKTAKGVMPLRRRSNSLGNVVSARCKEQIS